MFVIFAAAQQNNTHAVDDSGSDSDDFSLNDNDATGKKMFWILNGANTKFKLRILVSQSFALLQTVDGDFAEELHVQSMYVKEQSDAAAELEDNISSHTIRQTSML